jgi:hypothetical protein
MKKTIGFTGVVAISAFFVALGAFNSAMAQDKAAHAPAIKVLLENDKVRVTEATFKPGDENTAVSTAMPRVVRSIKGGTLQRTYADGKKETIVYKSGDVRYLEPGPGYSAKNIGHTVMVTYIVQLK